MNLMAAFGLLLSMIFGGGGASHQPAAVQHGVVKPDAGLCPQGYVLWNGHCQKTVPKVT